MCEKVCVCVFVWAPWVASNERGILTPAALLSARSLASQEHVSSARLENRRALLRLDRRGLLRAPRRAARVELLLQPRREAGGVHAAALRLGQRALRVVGLLRGLLQQRALAALGGAAGRAELRLERRAALLGERQLLAQRRVVGLERLGARAQRGPAALEARERVLHALEAAEVGGEQRVGQALRAAAAVATAAATRPERGRRRRRCRREARRGGAGVTLLCRVSSRRPGGGAQDAEQRRAHAAAAAAARAATPVVAAAVAWTRTGASAGRAAVAATAVAILEARQPPLQPRLCRLDAAQQRREPPLVARGGRRPRLEVAVRARRRLELRPQPRCVAPRLLGSALRGCDCRAQRVALLGERRQLLQARVELVVQPRRPRRCRAVRGRELACARVGGAPLLLRAAFCCGGFGAARGVGGGERLLQRLLARDGGAELVAALQRLALQPLHLRLQLRARRLGRVSRLPRGCARALERRALRLERGDARFERSGRFARLVALRGARLDPRLELRRRAALLLRPGRRRGAHLAERPLQAVREARQLLAARRQRRVGRAQLVALLARRARAARRLGEVGGERRGLRLELGARLGRVGGARLGAAQVGGPRQLGLLLPGARGALGL